MPQYLLRSLAQPSGCEKHLQTGKKHWNPKYLFLQNVFENYQYLSVEENLTYPLTSSGKL